MSAVFSAVLLLAGVAYAFLPPFYCDAQIADKTSRYDEIIPDYYYVTFNDWDGNELKVIRVPKYYDAIPPQDPVREGYTFNGWDKDFTNVQHDIVTTAQYVSEETSQGSLLGLWIWLGVFAVSAGAFVYIKMQEKKPLLPKEKNKEQNEPRQDSK